MKMIMCGVLRRVDIQNEIRTRNACQKIPLRTA
jgi:hypothetical protein